MLLIVAGRAFILAAAAQPATLSGVGALPATDQLEAAASTLEKSLAAGGSGIEFTVVARSTLYSKPGGPKIEVPDPIDRYKTLELADQYYVGAVIASGVATPGGFFLQMRDGPTTPDAEPDFANARATLAALVRDSVTWRNDGEGWYRTDQPPGIGLDPVTVGLLPRLLRSSTGAALSGVGVVDGSATTEISATAKVADIPGILAVDAASFTALVEPLTFDVDDAGQLRQIRAVSRNTRMTDFDLLVETVITMRYPDAVPTLPEPKPPWSAPDAPQS